MMLFALMLKVDVGWGQGGCNEIPPELLVNPDLQINMTATQGTDAYAFPNSLINGWRCSHGTPHYIGLNNGSCFYSSGGNAPFPFLFDFPDHVTCVAANTWSSDEGFYQTLNCYVKSDPLLTYTLTSNVGLLPCGGNNNNGLGILDFRLTNALNPNTGCDITNVEQYYPQSYLIRSQNLTSNIPTTVSVTINGSVLATNYSQLWILQPAVNNGKLAGIYDVSLTCASAALTGIDVPFGQCLAYTFEPIEVRPFADYEWCIDGNIVSKNKIFNHTFAQQGTYEVCLRALDECGCLAHECITVNAMCPTPDAGFTSSGDCPDYQFNVTNPQTCDSYRWEFGDGATSNVQNPAHTYVANGTYTVRLTVTNCGQVSTTTQEVLVNCFCPIPTVNFTHAENCTSNGNEVSFTSNATGEGLTYLWNLGGSNTNNTPNPTYIFPGNGTYTVTLTVTDACGQTASATQSIVVNCTPPSLTCDRESYPLVINLDGGTNGITFSQAVTGQGIPVDPSTINTYDNLIFAISGEVTLDVTAVFNGCKFVALSGALLILNSQYTPAQANAKGYSAFAFCEFFGCTRMWRGIRDEGNQASFLGGSIKDALYGIHAENSGTLSLWGVNFAENFVGIYFTSSPSQTIIGCNFQGGGLKLGYIGIPSYVTKNLAGIFVEQPQFDIFSGFNGATFLKVGQTGPYPNTFSNIRNGIIANGVLSIEIVNNTFNNMDVAFHLGSFNTNTSLSTVNSGNGIIINGGGFNKILLEKNTMTNGNNGVVINNTPFATPLIQKNNSITSFINGIWYRDNLLFGSSIDIKDNNTFNCTGSGVRFSNNNGPSFNFDNNTVMQSDGIVTASGSAGLRIASYSTNDPLNYYDNNGVGSITNNRFSISTDHHSNGMVLVDIYNHLTISNNEPFEVLEESSNLNLNGHGILSLTNVKSATIQNNIFNNRVPNTKLSQNILNNVKLSAVCCNQTNSLNFGFNYFGSGTGRSTFSQNIMNDNLNGISLQQNCAIGNQRDKGNIWIGDSRVAKYDGANPLNNTFFARESQNGPLVSGSLMGVDADFWPDQLPAVWFEEGSLDAEYECDLNQCELPLGAVSPESQPLAGDIQTLEDMLDHDHIVHEAHIAPSIWDKERWLYGFLTEHPQFLPASELLADFYNNVSTDVTAYEDFYLSINNALMISPGTKSHLDLLRSQAEALKSVHDIKWTAYQEVSNDVLLDELRVLRLEMASLDSILQSVIASVEATTAASLEQIKATVLSLPSDQPYTETAKMYAAILMDHLTLGDDYVATHHMDDLQYLANLCEPLYKETVFLARNMISHLNVNQNYDDNEICQNTENRKNDKQNVTEVLIYPNPTSGIFYVSSKGKISGYDIKDVSGKVLRSIIGHEPKCNLTDLTPGVYFITVHLEQGHSVTKRIVTLR